MSEKQQGQIAMPGGGQSLVGPKKVLGFISRFGEVHRLEKYSAISDIAGLKEVWQELETASNQPFCYFQSFDWCLNFIRQFANVHDEDQVLVPQVFVLKNRDTDKVVMIWPLQLQSGKAGLRELASLSCPLGQYSNLLYRPGAFDAELGRFVLKAITRSRVADALILDHFPAQSMLADIVGEKGFEVEAEQKSAILDLSRLEDWPSFFATFSKNQRKQLNRRRRNLEALG